MEGTILEGIVADLWPIINEYRRVYYLYAIGKHDGVYPNHRLITESELITERDIFSDYYKNNKGLGSLDDFDGDVLFCDNRPLSMFGSWIRLLNAGSRYSVKITKNEIILFRNSHRHQKEYTIENIVLAKSYVGHDGYNDVHKIGLFVRII